MKCKRLNNKLVEIEYDKNENADILDCTNEIEKYIEDVLPKEV